jgi:hypothetical protein
MNENLIDKLDASAGSGITKLDSINFDVLLKHRNPFAGGDSQFDLRGVRLITAAALTQLAAAAFALHNQGMTPAILIDDDSVRTYLVRVGFADLVGQVASIEPPFPVSGSYDFLHGTNPMLIELTRVHTGLELSDLLDRTVQTLRFRLKYRKYDAFDVATAISEIAQNSFDHNNASYGLIAMQVYGKGKKRFLEIGVADYGDGILSTLKRNPKYGGVRSDLDAIQKASELGVSEHDDPTRGTGLYHLLEIAFKHGGSVQIRSGSGKVRFRMDKRVGWLFPVPQVPGVQVALTLPSKGRA